MMVRVRLSLEAHLRALTVPAGAVVFEKDKRSVFLVEDGKAKKASVRTGFEEPQWVEILQGLKGDEAVIVAGKETVSNGSKVQVRGAGPGG